MIIQTSALSQSSKVDSNMSRDLMSSSSLYVCTQVHESHTEHTHTHIKYILSRNIYIQHTCHSIHTIHTCNIYHTAHIFTHNIHMTYIDNTQTYTIHTYKTHTEFTSQTSALLMFEKRTHNSFNLVIPYQDCLLLSYFLGDCLICSPGEP